MEKKPVQQSAKSEQKNVELEVKRVRKSIRTNVVGGWRIQHN